jgi:TP901 family phage tail tape measure protein
MSGRAIRSGRAFIEFFLEDSALKRGLAASERHIRKFGQNLKNIGSKALLTGLTALSLLTFPVGRMIDFDDAIRAAGAAAQATGADLAFLRTQALELGRTTSFTAVEVANLMGELGRAGFSVRQIDAMTASVLNLARATSTDATLASGIMAATIRQFSLDAADAAHVADVLTHAANATFNSVESLGEALSYAGPVASQLGMSLEETVAVLGTLGNVGVLGSNAGTALRRLTTITAAEADKMKEIFGVDFLDANKNIRPIITVLGELGVATKNLATGVRAQKFNEAFGLLGINASMVMSNTAVETQKLANELTKIGPVAATTAKAMDAGPGGAWRRMMSAAEGAAIALGDALAPTLEKAAAWITEFTGKVTAWISENQTLLEQIMKGIAYVTAFGVAAIVAGHAFTILATGIGLVASVVSIVTGLIISAISILTAISAAIVGIVTVVSGIGLPIAAVVAVVTTLGVAAAATAGYLLYTSGALGKVAAKFSEVGKSILGNFVTAWNAVIGRVQSGDLVGAMNVAGEFLKATWAVISAEIVAVNDRLWSGVKAAWALGLASLDVAWMDFWDGARLVAFDTLTLIGETISQFAAKFGQGLSMLFAEMKDHLQNAVDFGNRLLGRWVPARKSNQDKVREEFRNAAEARVQEAAKQRNAIVGKQARDPDRQLAQFEVAFQRARLTRAINGNEENPAVEAARAQLMAMIDREKALQEQQTIAARNAKKNPAEAFPQRPQADSGLLATAGAGMQAAKRSQSLAVDAVIIGTLEGERAIQEAIGLKQTDEVVSAVNELGTIFEDESEKTRRASMNNVKLVGSRRG